MKTKKAKIIIFALLVVISLVVFAIVILNGKNKEKTKKEYISPKISYPSDSKKANFTITLNVNEKDFSFPKEVPYLEKKESPISKDDAQKIASNLGFTKNPKEFDDIKEGKILIWNGDNYDLTINLKNRKIKYSPNHNPEEEIKTAPNKQLKNEDVVAIAKNFLKEKINIPEDKIYYTSTTLLKLEKEKEIFTEAKENDFQIYQVNFSQKINNIIIINPAPTQFLYYVQILKDGTILNSEINPVNDVNISNLGKVKIKGYKETLESIDQSVLISLDEGNINIPDIKNDFIQSIRVEKIELAYLLENDSRNNTLPPVFILTGWAKTKDTKEVKALLYLDASSKNQF